MDALRDKWPILLIGVVIIVGFGSVLWRRWRQHTGPGLPRGAAFIVDLTALIVTVLFVGAVATTQLPAPVTPTPTPTPVPLSAVEPTASPTETPTATLSPAPSPTFTVSPTPTASPTPAATVHVVQEGEVLAQIAQRYGVSVEAIREANNLTSDLLRVGQELIIPLPTPTPADTPPSAAPTATTTPTPAFIIHVVQQGEILGTIARQYGVTVDEILAVNPGLDPRRMRVGQEIRIPVR